MAVLFHSRARSLGNARGKRWCVAGLVVSMSALACSEPKDDDSTDESGAMDDSSGGSSGPPQTTLLVSVSNAICDTVGVTSVQVRARRVGCEHPPPSPCTLPSIPTDQLGDQATCPITDPEVVLGIVVDDPGKYLVDSVAHMEDGDPITNCYASSVMVNDVLVTSVDIEIGAHKNLVSLDTPCPEP
jgi:hypothetical protein